MNFLDRETASVARENRAHATPLQVLIVEDDLPLQRALLTFVRSEGLACEAVEDGASALAVVEQKSPEVVVLDLIMPVMDGYEFMERLVRQNGRGRPKVIVLSAKERLDLAQARLGAEAYLPKPFDPDRMRAALRRLVRPVRRTEP
jgi:CheY-like chemotaxis protein